VRTYDGSPLRAEHRAFIREYLASPPRLTGPLARRFRIELLVDMPTDQQIGTYGYVKGYSAVLVAIAPREPLALFELAYVLHGLVLQLTHLGVGTVWMGAAFNPADVRAHLQLEPDELIAAIVPLGYAGDHKRLIDYAAPLVLRTSKRKPMDTRYFYGDFTAPLGDHAPSVRSALDVARQAPSAKNRQSWRAVVSADERRIHIYAAFGLRHQVGTGRKQYACPPEYLDVGTWYRSLEVALEAEGIHGSLEVEDPGLSLPPGADMEYLATWVRG
jgi:nitroreductase